MAPWNIPTPVFALCSCLITATCIRLFESLFPVDHGASALQEAASYHVAAAAVTFAVLSGVIAAPFGKLNTQGWAYITVEPKAAWFFQEIPTLVAFVYRLYRVAQRDDWHLYWHIGNIVGAMYVTHYIQRCFVYPLTMRSKNRVPLSVTLSANVYCSFNGWLQSGVWGPIMSYHAPLRALTTASSSILLLTGVLLFGVGMAANVYHDRILANLRSSGQCPASGYVIPQGWGFRVFACPNLIAEMVEWIGYAIAGVTLEEAGYTPRGTGFATASFAIYVFANLAPRAASQHRWYIKTFGAEYLRLRRCALIPGVF